MAARGCGRDDRRAVGFHLRAFHERSISLRTARWSRMAACYRSCARRVANGWVREVGPCPGEKESCDPPKRRPTAATKLAMRTGVSPKLERVHDILRERRPALETMLAPRSVAVIGATEAEGSVGRTL